MEIEELQRKQAEHDKKYGHHHEEFEKIRHITLHMGKLLGKLSTYCEAHEHGAHPSSDIIRNEVIPDLLVYSLQLGNLFKINLERTYTERLEQNTQRLHAREQEHHHD